MPIQITDPFRYHRPDEAEIQRIERVRTGYFELLETLRENTQPGSVSGRYVSLACTALEESAMWATKSIVFERDNEPKKQPEP